MLNSSLCLFFGTVRIASPASSVVVVVFSKLSQEECAIVAWTDLAFQIVHWRRAQSFVNVLSCVLRLIPACLWQSWARDISLESPLLHQKLSLTLSSTIPAGILMSQVVLATTGFAVLTLQLTVFTLNTSSATVQLVLLRWVFWLCIPKSQTLLSQVSAWLSLLWSSCALL